MSVSIFPEGEIRVFVCSRTTILYMHRRIGLGLKQIEDRLLKFVQRPISHRVIACAVSQLSVLGKIGDSDCFLPACWIVIQCICIQVHVLVLYLEYRMVNGTTRVKSDSATQFPGPLFRSTGKIYRTGTVVAISRVSDFH
eukprot:COSAG02_NODE_7834_length_2830_cov_11.660564_3_plen_140_part_00